MGLIDRIKDFVAKDTGKDKDGVNIESADGTQAVALEPTVKENFKISTQVEVKIRRWNQEKQEYGPWYLHDKRSNLKPNVGLTFFLKQCYGSTASGTAMANTTTGTNFMAIGTSATAPASSDTALGAEITTNNLGRAQAAVTIAQPTATITNTFTDQTATTSSIQEGGLFDTATAGTGNLGHHFQFTSTTLNTGDQLTITVTVTVS